MKRSMPLPMTLSLSRFPAVAAVADDCDADAEEDCVCSCLQLLLLWPRDESLPSCRRVGGSREAQRHTVWLLTLPRQQPSLGHLPFVLNQVLWSLVRIPGAWFSASMR